MPVSVGRFYSLQFVWGGGANNTGKSAGSFVPRTQWFVGGTFPILRFQAQMYGEPIDSGRAIEALTKGSRAGTDKRLLTVLRVVYVVVQFAVAAHLEHEHRRREHTHAWDRTERVPYLSLDLVLQAKCTKETSILTRLEHFCLHKLPSLYMRLAFFFCFYSCNHTRVAEDPRWSIECHFPVGKTTSERTALHNCMTRRHDAASKHKWNMLLQIVSVQTEHEQHQRNCPQICTLESSVDSGCGFTHLKNLWMLQ